jgi:MFS family permease
MSLFNKWKFNIKIHYTWTFFSSILFLSPIITLYYKFYWLDIHDILVLTSIFTLFSTLLEIPTSTIWDTIGRVKVMKMSVLSSLFSFILIFLFPNIYIFYIAVFFSALWSALWSGTWHAKLQEDLEAASMQNQFWKVIWRLIALENIWKLFTPVVIYFVLKYFENWYRILAWLDVLAYSIWVFFVFKFIEFWKTEKYKNFNEFFISQKKVLKKAFNFLIWKNTLLFFLVLMILWNDLWYLARVLLPSLVDNWVKDFLSSYIIWFSVLAWILGNLIPQKLGEKLSWKKLFIVLIWINSILHFLAYLQVENNLILSIIFIFISFIIWIYWPTWNHIIMELTNIQEKATVRSLFLMIIWIFEAVFLFIFSFFDLKNSLLFLSIMIFISFILWIFSLFKKKKLPI